MKTSFDVYRTLDSNPMGTLPTPSRQFRLLLACAPIPLNDPEVLDLRARAAETGDWAKFVRLVARHQIASPVYSNLSRHAGHRLPADNLSQLRELHRSASLAALQAAAEVSAISTDLARRGVRAVCLKGAPLSAQLFGSVSMRSVSDIDLLVATDQLPQARLALQKAGYARTFPAPGLSPWRFQQYSRLYHHEMHARTDRKVHIELHWSLGNFGLFPERIMRDWLNAAVEIDFMRSSIYTLSPEHTLIYLLYHGASHRWVRLKWLLDVEQYFRRGLPLDWDRFQFEARKADLLQSCLPGLLLTEDLFGKQLPDSVRSALMQPNNQARALATEASKTLLAKRDQVFREGQAGGYKALTYLMRLYPTLRQRWGVLCEFLIRYEDWELIPLSDALSPLYVLIRPVSWVWRYRLKLARRVRRMLAWPTPS